MFNAQWLLSTSAILPTSVKRRRSSVHLWKNVYLPLKKFIFTRLNKYYFWRWRGRKSENEIIISLLQKSTIYCCKVLVVPVILSNKTLTMDALAVYAVPYVSCNIMSIQFKLTASDLRMASLTNWHQMRHLDYFPPKSKCTFRGMTCNPSSPRSPRGFVIPFFTNSPKRV